MKALRDFGNNIIIVTEDGKESDMVVDYLFSMDINKPTEWVATPSGLENLHLEDCKIESMYGIRHYKDNYFYEYSAHAFILEFRNGYYQWELLPYEKEVLFTEFKEI